MIHCRACTPARSGIQHDLKGTIGYRFDCAAGSVGYATDLGHVPAALIEHFAGIDLLCLESNYDEHMTVRSSRPVFVNRRNMSDSGHLSNEQAFEAVQRIAARSGQGSAGAGAVDAPQPPVQSPHEGQARL